MSICKNAAGLLALVVALSCYAEREDTEPATVSRHAASTETDSEMQKDDVNRMCDPQTSVFQTGDKYTVRGYEHAFKSKLMKGLFGKLGLPGHWNLEVVARDASVTSCYATFGFFMFGKSAYIQSHDWLVSIYSKKITRCQKEKEDLKKCTNGVDDEIDLPKDLEGGPEAFKVHGYVTRGKEMLAGRLSDSQAKLATLLREQAEPMDGMTFMNTTIIAMDISKSCQGGLVKPMLYEASENRLGVSKANSIFGERQCNCITFMKRFHNHGEELLKDLQRVTEVRSFGDVSVRNMTKSFLDMKELDAEAPYACCCTESHVSNAKQYYGPHGATGIYCKIAKDVTCDSLDELNMQYYSFEKMPRTIKGHNDWTIINSGSCMVLDNNDPLTAAVESYQK
jgi:hypothetical protein